MARYVGLGDAISDLRGEIVALRVKMRTERDPEAKRVMVTSMLNKIAQLMAYYQSHGDAETVKLWRDEYTRLSAAMAQVRQAVSAGESPSYIMILLDNIGDRIMKLAETVVATAGTVAKKVAESAGDIATGLGTTAKLLPLLLPVALVAAAFVIGGGGLGGVLRARRR
jgi:hypothetical protein